MLAFLLRRIGQSAFVMAAMALIVFVGVYALGNPIDILINPEADQIEREQAIARLGLDRPLWEQFWIFVKSAASGDLGRSFVHGVPAIDLIVSRMPATLEARLRGARARSGSASRSASPRASSRTRSSAARS